MKVYTTRVGEGSFPTELNDSLGEEIKMVGREYGATTGRPRRCGWFDVCLARYACQINGFTHLVITKGDVLDHFPQIRVCVGYKLNGKVLRTPPPTEEELNSYEPIYRDFEGWLTPTGTIRKYQDLPKKMRD